MTENHVLDLIVSHYEDNGWDCFYRTNRRASVAGMDAALFKHSDKFVIIEAKGEPSSSAVKSSSLTGILGTIIKRIKINCGYRPRINKNKFKWINGINMKEHMESHAFLANCEYVLAMPESYRESLEKALDPQLAAMLNIVVYTVSDSDVTRLYW